MQHLHPADLGRVALVEDDDDIRELTRIALEEIGGLTARCWSSATQALREMPAFGPELIVLDVVMPGMDGCELRRRLADTPELAKVPTLFLTAKSMRREIEELKAMDVLDVIRKPFDFLTLAQELQSYWARAFQSPDWSRGTGQALPITS